jgi:hypothetical protein
MEVFQKKPPDKAAVIKCIALAGFIKRPQFEITRRKV